MRRIPQKPEVSYYLTKIAVMIGRDGFDGITKDDLLKKEVTFAQTIEEIPEPIKSWGKRVVRALEIIGRGDRILPPYAKMVTEKKMEIKKILYPDTYKNMFNTTYYRDVVGRKK